MSEKTSEETEFLFQKLSQIQVEESIAQEFLIAHVQRARAAEISLLALDVAEGRKDFELLHSSLEKLNEIVLPNTEEKEFVELSDSEEQAAEGFKWRLSCLNKSLGPLRNGNFGFLFARPEAGKTTFALDQSTYFSTQSERPTIYFNNEQPGELMYIRAVQATLGINYETFIKYKKQAVKKFKDLTKEQFFIYDSAYLSRKDCEKICRKYNPALLVFDQLDKVKGFHDDQRHDLELKHAYQWARELSKEYGPVIGLCQAGGSAEGKKWLTMDDVDSSKTSKQGESDWILGLGKSNNEGLENIRHFNISKNKLLGGKETDPSMRHGKMDVKIKPEICRFEDI